MRFGWLRRHERHLEEYRRRREEQSPCPGRAVPEPPPAPMHLANPHRYEGRNPAEPESVPPGGGVPAESDDAEATRAEMLTEKARQLTRAGRHADAAAPARAAVRMQGVLAGKDHRRHGPALVGGLRAFAAVLAADGRAADAVKVATSAVEHARRLGAIDHRTHRPLLAASLRELGARLGDNGDEQAALAALRESVQLFRTLAAQAPERHRAELALSLDELAGRLAATGAAEAALAAFTEAERLLGIGPPDARQAAVLLRHATLLARLGRGPEAVALAADAVEVRRTYAGADHAPAGRREDELAASLQSLGLLHSAGGAHDEAVDALEEAVRLRARRVRADPVLARLPEVPVTYALYGIVLVAAGRPADAVPPLAAALGVGTALNLERVSDLAGDTLVRAHRADPDAVRNRWLAATGEELPAWIERGQLPLPRQTGRRPIPQEALQSRD
ncbi:tetratricopeptide repeat protein [Embleya sp. NBC_00896]|uniref:tetratricopeptide repeat protein n=1 Tax=Embleya sp. NBC_00896 TaxID=2975961 RepID=UPI00386407E6|nr:tetratricopeptide repeat protein [Embleya sp. NBC_00896]